MAAAALGLPPVQPAGRHLPAGGARPLQRGRGAGLLRDHAGLVGVPHPGRPARPAGQRAAQLPAAPLLVASRKVGSVGSQDLKILEI